jgi:hypothetical protein
MSKVIDNIQSKELAYGSAASLAHMIGGHCETFNTRLFFGVHDSKGLLGRFCS